MPRISRPLDTCCTPWAVMASMAGVRAPSWAMPVARRSRSVTEAIAASGVNASNAQYSATHTESTPMRSAWRATSRKRGIDGSTDSPIWSVTAWASGEHAASARRERPSRRRCRHVHQAVRFDRITGLGVDELQPHVMPRVTIDEAQAPLRVVEHVTVAPLAQGDQHVAQLPALVGQPVLLAAAPAVGLIGRRGEDPGGDEATQPVRQRRPADPEAGDEVVEAAHPVHHVADDQDAPTVAEQVERPSHRARPSGQRLPVQRLDPTHRELSSASSLTAPMTRSMFVTVEHSAYPIRAPFDQLDTRSES